MTSWSSFLGEVDVLSPAWSNFTRTGHWPACLRISPRSPTSVGSDPYTVAAQVILTEHWQFWDACSLFEPHFGWFLVAVHYVSDPPDQESVKPKDWSWADPQSGEETWSFCWQLAYSAVSSWGRSSCGRHDTWLTPQTTSSCEGLVRVFLTSKAFFTGL